MYCISWRGRSTLASALYFSRPVFPLPWSDFWYPYFLLSQSTVFATFYAITTLQKLISWRARTFFVSMVRSRRLPWGIPVPWPDAALWLFIYLFMVVWIYCGCMNISWYAYRGGGPFPSPGFFLGFLPSPEPRLPYAPLQRWPAVHAATHGVDVRLDLRGPIVYRLT